MLGRRLSRARERAPGPSGFLCAVSTGEAAGLRPFPAPRSKFRDRESSGLPPVAVGPARFAALNHEADSAAAGSA